MARVKVPVIPEKPSESLPIEVVSAEKSSTDEGWRLLIETMAMLRGELDNLNQTRPNVFDPDHTNAAANVGRAVVGLASEIRKLEAYERKTSATVDEEEKYELVCAYITELTPEKRDGIARLLAGLGCSEVANVLGRPIMPTEGE